jgi:adenine deaminase
MCLCTDDREPSDLLEEGSIDHLVRMALAAGVNPVVAVRLGSLNAAEHFGLRDRGAVAPGRRADLVVFSDWADLRAELVFQAGRLVARDGCLVESAGDARPPRGRGSDPFRASVRVDGGRVSFAVPAAGPRVRVIGVVADQIVTAAEVGDARIRDGLALADPACDLVKMAVVERHGRSGGVGLGFVRGLGLRRGALASTVAHDHHNLVVAGADDRSMATAARAVCAAGGGQAVACGEEVLALLPLPIAGLLSDRPVEGVRAGADSLRAAAKELGSPLRSPFATLSFLALEVVPELKLTDRGLVSVPERRIVPLFPRE